MNAVLWGCQSRELHCRALTQHGSCSPISAQAPTLLSDRGWCWGRPSHLPGVDTEGTEHHAGEVGVQVLAVEGAEVQITVQSPP